jgi:hypothetical protein
MDALAKDGWEMGNEELKNNCHPTEGGLQSHQRGIKMY